MLLNKRQIRSIKTIDGWDEFVKEAHSSSEKKRELLAMAKRGEPRPVWGIHVLSRPLSRYTNKKNNTYDFKFNKQIRKLAPQWFIDTVAENKKQLIAMAKRGEPRPNGKTHSLGHTLCNYINKHGSTYEPKFDKLIRKLAPHWFVNTADEKKKQLLAMAKKGGSRPIKAKHPLAEMLIVYTNKTKNCYDPKFDKEIRQLAPHWFVSQSDIANDKKQQLLEMAKRGEARPSSRSHPLGGVLLHYTGKTGCYDPKFDKQIRKLAPHWFVDTATENKKQLIAMAKRGQSRPSHKKHPLGPSLSRYTNKTNTTSYDPKFDKAIRELAPQWFVKTADENKKQLIEMAKKGEPRPNSRKRPLGSVLTLYTCKKCNNYDSKFDKNIRKLAPHWFIDTVVENKKQLLAMAKKGEPKPIQGKHPLGNVLSNYLSKSGDTYDPKFSKQIRKLAPHWFKKGK